MKKIFFALSAIVAFSSCDSFKQKDVNNSTSTAPTLQREDVQYNLPRDTTITPTNSYSDMFLDSASIETYISNKAVSPDHAQTLRGFYNPRNYGYAWFSHDGLTEQGRAFWNAYTYANIHGQKDSLSDKVLNRRMDTLLNVDTLIVTDTDTSIKNIEMALTLKFIQYRRNSDPQSMIYQAPLTRLIPVKKTGILEMADSILHENYSTDTSNNQYEQLKTQLTRYDSIAKDSGWQPIIANTSMLKKGSRSPLITAIKKRLLITEEMTGADTSSKFNDSLEIAIKSYQKRNGFKPDGIITDSLIAVMNVPVEQRIQQILVNMTRMLWLPLQIKDNYVEVNIPDYMLNVYEGNTKAFDMPVVVGKEGSNTMMFAGDLNEIVFSPYWKIPASIVKNEILPEMQNDPEYLKSKRMEIVRKNDSVPEIRQLPGPGNALGQVKFMFPNSYEIYLHDTEAKELFESNRRAFSHGCIRLADAEKMAGYVLRDQREWTPEKIKTAMNNAKEQHVAVKKKIPVLITYFTTWIDEDGQLNFREDIYAHDKRMADKMFTTSV